MLYRAISVLLAPLARWGRVRVEGLDHVLRTGPLLLVPNHDSQMDPVVLALALRRVRPVRFLARANLWKLPGLGATLTAIGQIPIQRGAGDDGALARAAAILGEGEAICVFPEGALSHGRDLRARSGAARLWHAYPDARVVLCAITGSTGYVRFPRRPRVTVRFLEPTAGQPRGDEEPRALADRLLRDVRAVAPPVAAGRRPARHARPHAATGGAGCTID
jgi:1-acyl-sn-glycerol-3-phosphate acyltransferase